jgi:thioredoxin-related protein
MKQLKSLIIGLVFFTTSYSSYGQVQWMTFEQMQEAQKKSPRKVIVDIYTDWCGWCKKLDKDVYGNPYIAEYINRNYYAIKFNAEKNGPVIFKGETYALKDINPKKQTHSLALKLMNNRAAYPATALLNENLELYSTVPGYMEVKEFEAMLVYFKENHFQAESWNDFRAKFIPKVQQN